LLTQLWPGPDVERRWPVMMDDPWWCFSFSQEGALSENHFSVTVLVWVHIMDISHSTQTELLSEREMGRAVLPECE